MFFKKAHFILKIFLSSSETEKFVSYVSLIVNVSFNNLFCFLTKVLVLISQTFARRYLGSSKFRTAQLSSVGFVEFFGAALPNPVRLLIIVFNVVEGPALGLGQKPVKQHRSQQAGSAEHQK